MIKIKEIFSKLISFIFPHKCLLCSKIIENDIIVCSECWNKMNFIRTPFCDKCSTPYKYDINNNDICVNCIKNTPPYIKLRSSVVYDENISKIVSNFKFKDNFFLKKQITKSMVDSSKDIIDNIDILIPVPLHKKRLIYRKYNQSLLLCKEISKLTNKKFIYDFLIKTKHTLPQVSLSQKERKENLKNKFSINKKYLKDISKYKKYNFAIIDDVTTTGSTINECIKTLNKNNIKNVYIITFAKTVYN